MLEAEKRNDALDNIKGSGNISRVQTLEFRISLGGGGSEEIWNSSENMHFFFEGFPNLINTFKGVKLWRIMLVSVNKLTTIFN